MLIRDLLGERMKQKPGDAVLTSHVYLVRGGYIRRVSNGIYSLLPPAKRIASKIENVIREEMDRIGGQEVLFPVALPADLLKESGRYFSIGSEMVRFQDRTGNDMVLGMTHEEAAVHLARNEALSYTKYPFMIYQIQTKIRDEPRSRGGLIRVREFIMKDAYSFHTSQEDLNRFYNRVLEAYHRIFQRVGLPEVISVRSDTGMMGGDVAHEFMLLTDAGEDTIVLCESCGYRANIEVAVSKISSGSDTEQPLEEVYTPGIKDIDSLAGYLNIPAGKTMKATVFSVENSPKPLVVFIRGDLQVSEAKLRKLVKSGIKPFTAYDETDLQFGFIGAVGLDRSKVDILFDLSLKGERNTVCGANRVDYHLRGVSIERDIKDAVFADVAKVSENDSCVHCGGRLTLNRGIEVGNIFQLDTKYTESMNMTYIDKDGERKHPVMGCYGIGIGRLIACIIESHHDEFGPVWPKAVAPWQVHICMLNGSIEEVNRVGQNLYDRLNRSFEVIFDNREVAAGIQFADADLLGVPVRIIVSKRNVENGEVEIVTRDKKIRETVPVEHVESRVRELLVE
ncbi:MAG: proline--tRNA ligase [Clostridiaceae bacterium]|nr:proline--tRNA ligase [Clostridiaceae bacterium]